VIFLPSFLMALMTVNGSLYDEKVFEQPEGITTTRRSCIDRGYCSGKRDPTARILVMMRGVAATRFNTKTHRIL
jgi:hypothetical protein